MATRIKTPAAQAPQTLAEVQSDIRAIGDLQRQHARSLADLNDKIAALTEEAGPVLKDLSDRIAARQKGVQAYCEAHREELCGKGKTANLVTGEVLWRLRPPSVRVAGVDAVIAWLKKMGLDSFVRIKEEVNKEAMLNEQEKAKAVPGVTIVTGVEDFVIVPFEVENEVAA
ncbi:MAG: host-nuclease inhibitor Gam family protein [Rhodoferax sp.]